MTLPLLLSLKPCDRMVTQWPATIHLADSHGIQGPSWRPGWRGGASWPSKAGGMSSWLTSWSPCLLIEVKWFNCRERGAGWHPASWLAESFGGEGSSGLRKALPETMPSTWQCPAPFTSGISPPSLHICPPLISPPFFAMEIRTLLSSACE